MKTTKSPAVTLAAGLALIALAVVFYAISGEKTSLIPAGVGLPVALCGALAFKPSLRKIFVHVALVLALLGFLATLGRVPKMLSGDGPILATIATSLMGLICLGYVGYGVQSFIAARRARSA